MDDAKLTLGPELEVVLDDAGEPAAGAYQNGWTDAMESVRAAMRKGGSWKADEYFEGWMDAVTLQAVDPIRLAPSRSRYARGYAAGAQEYDVAQRGGYDAQ